MKILHVVPTYYPAVRYGGPIYSVHGLCKALVKAGHEVHVCTTNVDGQGNLDVPTGQVVDVEGVKVWYFSSEYLRRLYYSPAMKQFLHEKMQAFDIVHLHSIFLWPTWAAARIAEKASVPYVLAPRGMLVRDLVARKSRLIKNIWLTLIERHTLEHAAFLHVTTELEAKEARFFGYRLPPVKIIPNGVNTNGLEQALEEQGEKPEPENTSVLFIGRINWKKGLDRLIKSLQGQPQLNLVIAGNDEEGYRSQLIALAQRQGMVDRVKFIGEVRDKEKFSRILNAPILVLPSYSENFGNVVPEAWAASRPVAVTREVGIAEMVEKYHAGIIIPGEPEAMGQALARIIKKKDLLEEMGRNGRKLLDEYFSWNVIAENMISEYKNFVSN